MTRDTRDDEAAQKARADAIRRARDARNRALDTTNPPGEPGELPADTDGATPNYVDLIDREMRRPKKPE